ncbi:serine/threonine protein kinase, partial [Photobacterium sanctipauli]
MPSDKTRLMNIDPSSNSDRPDSADKVRYGLGDILKGRFRLEKELGRGGMGSVYKALDLRQQEANERFPWVAVKIMDASTLSSEETLMCLQRETTKSRGLSHPNIVRVFDFDREDNCVFMTMEYLEGVTLDSWIVNNPLPSYQDCMRIWGKIASALEYAHEQGLVHCDFKPNNVFICDNGDVKVIDFGISRVNADVINKATVTRFDISQLGALTPAYASCEMIEALQPVRQDDIYSFAVVMYEMLTGRHPFNGLMATQARAKKLKPERVVQISQSEWKKLSVGLSFNRSQRPVYASELISGGKTKKLHFSKTVKIVMIIFALVMFSTVSYYMFFTRGDTNLDIEVPVVETIPMERYLSESVIEEITFMLSVADAHMGVGNIISPPGNNAYEAYLKVLSLDPKNVEAEKGLSNIADINFKEAKNYILMKDAERAHVAIQRGLKVSPNHKGLNSLMDDLEK